MVEQEGKPQILQTKAIKGTIVSGEKRQGQLNAAGPKSRNVNISFNLSKLQSSNLSSNAKKEGLEIYWDDLAGLRR